MVKQNSNNGTTLRTRIVRDKKNTIENRNTRNPSQKRGIFLLYFLLFFT